MNKTVEKLDVAKFRVATYETRVSRTGDPYQEQIATLDLDFNPIIAQLSEREKSYSYNLIHWQAKPKGDREWGVYDPVKDTYICSVFSDHPTAYGAVKMMMIDDATADSIPSAIIYFVGSLPIYSDFGIASSEDPSVIVVEP